MLSPTTTLLQKAVNHQTPKIRSALQILHQHGVNALLPTKRTLESEEQNFNKLKAIWQKPMVSKRIGNDLRKKAIREGTYGTYNPNTGTGWDANWDFVTKTTMNPEDGSEMTTRTRVMGGGTRIPFMQMRPPKETKRERTREARASRIELLLEQADDKIADYREDQLKKKPKPGIENVFKRLVKKQGTKK
mmetsp:Transcript_1281/g.1835  ORF Transcript_1281/g.1835 Transcript_1281/m.1835 type:complete len:190 (-) Transcript_1281:83-652(-)|eukprot:CAMPEP_0184855482 /NCGR_PEP_ID=MMETSP0580-20130426/722_1 /TAXON_ID=1118495 /ORGANISM="Dactyliosolen fragilissimus" /LENGTH=189 /DNA_ID=CAMNT_0027350007 /DNA_START=187 /DNA_END=756 /DNA_ORIENTATION=-